MNIKAVLLVIALAIVASSARKVMFDRAAVPNYYAYQRRAELTDKVDLMFALKQRNLDILDDLFWAVSDPKSESYGNFLTKEEILDIIAPPQRIQDRVMNYIRSFGGVPRSLGDAIAVTLDVAAIEQMFQTEMHVFADIEGREIIRQLGEYSLSAQIADVVEMVAGISEFPMPRPSAYKRAGSDSYVAPQSISTIYNIGDSTADSSSSQGVAEFQGDQGYSKDDLSTFYTMADITTTDVDHFVGPFGGLFPDVEASLDIQYITATGINADNWYWTEENWMYEFATNFFNNDTVPMVVSMSWGWSEIAQCDIDTECSTLGVDSQTYVERTNTEFQKIGLRGTTLLASSGDSGANGRTDPLCTDSVLHPIFPGASPYVTAVGATELQNAEFNLQSPPDICNNYNCASGGTEVAVSYQVSGFTSGGGFSVYAARPSYQDDAVEAYLADTDSLPPASSFNSSGRAYPDIAALGHNFLCYIGGRIMPVGGTSASAPTVGGIIAILNSVRLQTGQSAIGFANPFLYQMYADHPAAYTDVTSGDNICTEYGCASRCVGFKATTGWDAVTGLGTPNVDEMISYVKSQA